LVRSEIVQHGKWHVAKKLRFLTGNGCPPHGIKEILQAPIASRDCGTHSGLSNSLQLWCA
jgi:hypothetical protein